MDQDEIILETEEQTRYYAALAQTLTLAETQRLVPPECFTFDGRRITTDLAKASAGANWGDTR